MATHSSTLAWKIPWMEEPRRLQSMGSQKVGHNWAASLSLTLYLNFLSLYLISLFCPRTPPWIPHSISSSRLIKLLWTVTVCQAVLVFMTSTVLRITGHVFRMSLYWVFPNFSPHGCSVVMGFEKKDHKGEVSLSHPIKATCYQHDITEDVFLDHLAALALVRFR